MTSFTFKMSQYKWAINNFCNIFLFDATTSLIITPELFSDMITDSTKYSLNFYLLLYVFDSKWFDTNISYLCEICLHNKLLYNLSSNPA